MLGKKRERERKKQKVGACTCLDDAYNRNDPPPPFLHSISFSLLVYSTSMNWPPEEEEKQHRELMMRAPPPPRLLCCRQDLSFEW